MANRVSKSVANLNRKGRKAGTPNKLTASAKEALEYAFHGLGGADGLMRWGQSNPDGFYPVWAKLLPKNVDVTSGGKPLTAEQRRERLAELLGLAGG